MEVYKGRVKEDKTVFVGVDLHCFKWHASFSQKYRRG